MDTPSPPPVEFVLASNSLQLVEVSRLPPSAPPLDLFPALPMNPNPLLILICFQQMH